MSRRREKEAQEGAKPAEPKAFLPTVKKTGGDTAAEMTQTFMKSTNQEAWEKLNYHDENVRHVSTMPRSIANLCLQTPNAYETYEERLFLSEPATAPKLHSSLNNNQFLDTISAPSSSRGARKRTGSKRGVDELVEISDVSDEEDGTEPHVS